MENKHTKEDCERLAKSITDLLTGKKSAENYPLIKPNYGKRSQKNI